MTSFYKEIGMNRYVYGVMLVLLVAVSGSAREKNVGTTDEFKGQVRKNPLAVAFFYTSQFDKKENRDYGKELKDARRAFESASKIKRYEDGGVGFVAVDLAKKNLVGTEKLYGIEKLPTYRLFYRGKPFKSASGMPVSHVGFLEKEKISTMIERNFGKKITGYFKEQARLRQRAREESRSVVSPYVYWGFGGGYPYGYPYYYGAPGFGVSIGL